jgi:hypothetical protein
MPANDKYHETVIQSLKKDGWRITEEQVVLSIGRRRLLVDVEASHEKESSVVFIEIKGFENAPSIIDYLENAIGQYVLYRAILESSGTTTPLYMAIPIAAYVGIFNEEVGKVAIERLNLKLMVFNPMLEEVVEWIY